MNNYVQTVIKIANIFPIKIQTNVQNRKLASFIGKPYEILKNESTYSPLSLTGR